MANSNFKSLVPSTMISNFNKREMISTLSLAFLQFFLLPLSQPSFCSFNSLSFISSSLWEFVL